MISRSLGLEVGAAVGIPLYLAQALGISFYIVGFTEAITNITNVFPARLIDYSALGGVFFLAYASANTALKSQYFIFAAIAVSLIALFTGSTPSLEVMEKIHVEEMRQSFWHTFAIFFPAVTGILAGVSMSGDLKNPSRSLPIGTISAVISGYVVYIAIAIFLWSVVPNPGALKSSLIMQKVASFEPFIIVGVLGATISSALGSMLGAPRTLQALARDGILSKHLRFLANESGKSDEPRNATYFTGVIALFGLWIGDLNAIAPVLSMFFLTAYGVLNFSAGIESLIANPAWRPLFRVYWYISILGALACFATMFMINSGATIIAIIIAFLIFYYVHKKDLRANFGDLRRGILSALARYSISRLAILPNNINSWRPNILCFCGTPSSRWHLIQLAHAITHGKGFLTVSTIVPKASSAEDRIPQVRSAIEDYLKKRDVHALVNVSVNDDVINGVTNMVHTYGLGSLVPNTIMLGAIEKQEKILMFTEMIIRIYQAKRNIIIVKKSAFEMTNVDHQIQVWWGRERDNAGFALVLGYMLQSSPELANAQLQLNTIVTTPDEVDKGRESLEKFIKEGRFEAQPNVYLNPEGRQNVFETLGEKANTADLVFLGMEPPKIDEFLKDKQTYLKTYAQYYSNMILRIQNFPQTALVIAAEDIKFSEIFR